MRSTYSENRTVHPLERYEAAVDLGIYLEKLVAKEIRNQKPLHAVIYKGRGGFPLGIASPPVLFFY